MPKDRLNTREFRTNLSKNKDLRTYGLFLCPEAMMRVWCVSFTHGNSRYHFCFSSKDFYTREFSISFLFLIKGMLRSLATILGHVGSSDSIPRGSLPYIATCQGQLVSPK